MSNKSSNTTNVPEAREAMDKFKMEVASELGVPLSDGYNGNLTSAQNGSVGGYDGSARQVFFLLLYRIHTRLLPTPQIFSYRFNFS